MADVHASALGYAAHGWRVFPLVRGRKVPHAGTRGVLEATCDAGTIERWWCRWPGSNIGLATGSGLCVLDSDGEEGEAGLRSRHLPPTPSARTTRGWHRYFAGDLPSRGSLLPQVDLKGAGGYVVAPPSVHPSGAAYVWAEGLSPDDLDIAPVPDWIFRLAHRAGDGRRLARGDWARFAGRTVAEGCRHTTLARLAGKVLASTLDPELSAELLSAWAEARCDPPLPPQEVMQVISDIAAREARKVKEKP
jgi:hypothetical protein